jgi:hypothetical protein
MNLVNITGLAVPLPACARRATVCAAIEGREVPCPAAMQRTCPTLAAIRHMMAPVAEHSAPQEVPA